MTTQTLRPVTRPEDIARELLLGSHLFDSLTLDSFRRFFPVDLRASDAVASLHKEYTKQRRMIRKQVETNIDTFFNNREGVEMAENIEKLKVREEALRTELKALEDKIAEKKEALENFSENLRQLDLSEVKHLESHELQEISKELSKKLQNEERRQ